MLPTTLYEPPTVEQLAEAQTLGKMYLPKYDMGKINHWQLLDSPVKRATGQCRGCMPKTNI